MRSTKVTTWYSDIVTDSHTYNIRCGSQGNFQNPSWASTVWVVLVVSSFARLHKDLSNCENLLICFHLSLCQALATRGVHVTYGGMSRKPVTAATSHMIFKVSSRNDTRWIYSLRPCLADGWWLFPCLGSWAAWFLDGQMEWETGQEWSKVYNCINVSEYVVTQLGTKATPYT